MAYASALAVVTGTSSGIGEALARELLAREWRVVGLARRAAPITDLRYTHLQLDVGNLAALTSALDATVAPLVADPATTRVGLVNNAATEALLGPIGRLDAAALVDVYTVNTAAPILLMGWFLRHARAGQALRIVNVSTGAATIPFPGLAAYANTKAALRMAGMVLAAELDAGAGARRADAPGGADANAAGPDVSVLSFEPGVVDTQMQVHARSSPAHVLPSVEMFKNFVATGALLSPAVPAREMADYLDADGHQRWEERRVGGARPGQ